MTHNLTTLLPFPVVPLSPKGESNDKNEIIRTWFRDNFTLSVHNHHPAQWNIPGGECLEGGAHNLALATLSLGSEHPEGKSPRHNNSLFFWILSFTAIVHRAPGNA